MATQAAPLGDECFFIAPIGEEDSEVRRRSDGVLNFIVKPAVEELGLTAVRADEIGAPGQITLQVIQHVLEARAAVVDLTGANPNVFYELAIRHGYRLPTVLIAEQGEKLPFDIAQMRTIFFDHKDLESAAECKDQITAHLRGALEGAVDSPIGTAVDVGSLEKGSSTERTLAELVTTVEELGARMSEAVNPRGGPPVSRAALGDVLLAYEDLVALAKARDDGELGDVLKELRRPLGYIQRRSAATPDLVERRRELREARRKRALEAEALAEDLTLEERDSLDEDI